MFDSPTPIRSTLVVESTTPSADTLAAPRRLSLILGEENNQQQQQQQQVSSKNIIDTNTSAAMKPLSMTTQQVDDEDTSSDCGTEISVKARRDWLKQFEQKQKANPFRKMPVKNVERRQEETSDPRRACMPPPKTPERSMEQRLQQAVSSAISNSPHRASTTVRVPAPRATSSRPVTSTSVSKPPSLATPLRSTRTRRKEQVQATDEGYASVKELSQWLAADPTSTKKKKQVRRGRNVILKSRHFETSNDVIMVENNISKGAVKDRKKWLSHAFHEDDDCASSVVSGASRYYAKSEIAGGASSYAFSRFQSRPPKAAAANVVLDSQSEIILDDAASSLSVADKKDWLKNAFSGKKSSAPSPAKARTDVMFNRSPCRTTGDVASRAKMRFKERSARKLLDSSRSPMKTKEENTQQPSYSPMKKKIESTREEEFTERTESSSSSSVEEDTAPVDFRAAREALVQRSKKNGNKVDVINKVYLRKKKFEKIEEENRRMSSVQGLVMKSSWDLADPTKGLPSDSFEKKQLVPDIAPKKSFEELP